PKECLGARSSCAARVCGVANPLTVFVQRQPLKFEKRGEDLAGLKDDVAPAVVAVRASDINSFPPSIDGCVIAVAPAARFQTLSDDFPMLHYERRCANPRRRKIKFVSKRSCREEILLSSRFRPF